MKWTIQVSESWEVIHVTTSGCMNLEKAMQMISEVDLACNKCKIKKLMVDYRETDLEFSPFDIYRMPHQIRNKGITDGRQIALLISSDKPHVRDFAFMKTILLHYKFNIQLFTNEEDAEMWLSGIHCN